MTKNFVPLECNPDVLDQLIYRLGVSKQVHFCDVWSIEAELIPLIVTRPVYAVLLVFPISENYEKYRNEFDSQLKDDYYNEISGTDKENVLWFKQTVGNACGTMAVLHATANSLPKELIDKDSTLDTFINEIKPLNVQERVKVLENSQEIEDAHGSVAVQGSTEAPSSQDNVDLHYVCICKNVKDGHLYELDGRRKGPIDHGLLKPDEDALGDTALKVIKGFMQRESENGQFSIVAMKSNV